jgi:hypothetical protein
MRKKHAQKVVITCVNVDKGYQFSEFEEPAEGAHGEIFRHYQSEFGRCISKMFAGNSQVGWVFQKRTNYEDRGQVSRETYIQETWVGLV